MTTVQSSSGGVVICYVLPFLWMMFAHKPRLLDVAAQLKRSLGLDYKLCAVIGLPVAGQRTHGITFLALKVTSQVATPGAESAVYDCIVCVCSRSVLSTAEVDVT